MKLFNKQKPIVLISLGLLIFVSTVALAYKPFTTVFSTAKSYKHVDERLAEVAQLRALLLTLSSAERDFVATRDPEYRAAYSGAAAKIRHIIDDLKDLSSDGPEQKLQLDRLGDLMGKRLALARQAVNSKEAVEPALIDEEDGLMRDLETLLSGRENEENARLWQKDASVRESMWIVLILGERAYPSQFSSSYSPWAS